MKRLLVLLLSTPFASACLAQVVVGELHPRKMLAMLGAKIENSATTERLSEFETIFQRFDTNDDGYLSAKEFVEDGTYLTPPARRAIFRASDSNGDQIVSKSEYVINRVITDEAKQILQTMDADRDGNVSKQEFVAGCTIEDKKIAVDVFSRFDSNGDSVLVTSEYLSVWGKWARTAPVSARLIVKQDTYDLPTPWQKEEFRTAIKEQEDIEQLPEAPTVKLVLEIHNTGDDPIMIWPGGRIDDPELTVVGPGIVRPENLQGGFGSSSGTTPQPVIAPGKKFRIKIDSLNPDRTEFVYWTKPGEYQISATYPVWKNLPSHLPTLFKDYPKPKGAPIQFLSQTAPVTVKVVAK